MTVAAHQSSPGPRKRRRQRAAVYVADTNGHRVSVWQKARGRWRNVAILGSDECGDGADEFCFPVGVAVDATGRLFIRNGGGGRGVSIWQDTCVSTAP